MRVATFTTGNVTLQDFDAPVLMNLVEPQCPGPLTKQDIEEDFPKNRADSDFFTFYFFAVAFPIAVLLIVAHLILHGLPVVGFIVSLLVSSFASVAIVGREGCMLRRGERLSLHRLHSS